MSGTSRTSVMPPAVGEPPSRLIPDNAQYLGSRSEQQDSFYYSDLENAELLERAGALVVVADGMGGLADGRQTSQLACRTFRDVYESRTWQEPIPDALLRAAQAANEAVLAAAAGKAAQIGTTLVAAVVHGRSLFWISAGDSRLYLFREGELAAITLDHDYARELDRAALAGTLSEAEAQRDPQRSALTSYLGRGPLTRYDQAVRPFTLVPGDRLLLCSDGLYNALSSAEISGLLQQQPEGQTAAALIERVIAKQIPHQDNVTVALLELRAAARPHAALSGARPVPAHTRRAGRRSLLVLLLAVAVLGLVAALSGPGPLPRVIRWPAWLRGAADSAAARPAPDSGVVRTMTGDTGAAATPADSILGTPARDSRAAPHQPTPDTVPRRVPANDPKSRR